MGKINGVEAGKFLAQERKRLGLGEEFKGRAEKEYEARKAAEEKGATAAATKLGGEFRQAISGAFQPPSVMQTPFTPSPAQQAAAAEQRMAQQGMAARAAAESKRMTSLPATESGADYTEPKTAARLVGESIGGLGSGILPAYYASKVAAKLPSDLMARSNVAAAKADLAAAKTPRVKALLGKVDEASKAFKAATGPDFFPAAKELRRLQGAAEITSDVVAAGTKAGQYSKALSKAAGIAGSAPVAVGGKVLGKVAAPLAVASELYDVGRFAFDEDARNRMTEEVGQQDTFGSAALSGLVSPSKTALGAANLYKQGMEAKEAARASAADYGVLQERLARRSEQQKPLREEMERLRRQMPQFKYDDKKAALETMPSSERVKLLQSLRKQALQNLATAR